MRAIWKGTINFGMVNIPVNAISMAKEEKISLKQLRKNDLSPIRYKKVAEADGKEVSHDQIVKGFEYEKNKFVVLSEDELLSVRLESVKAITIEEFVPAGQIAMQFIHKPYVLEAGKAANTPYSLLHKALAQTNMVGIGKVALRNREYLMAIIPDNGRLMMVQLRFANDLVDISGVSTADTKVDAAQLEMAKKLIDAMAKPALNLEHYKNDYFGALTDLIETKVGGGEISMPVDDKPARTSAPDMIAILQASLDAKKAA